MEEQDLEVPKRILYEEIKKLRQSLGISYPVNMMQIVDGIERIELFKEDLATPGLNGIAYRARKEGEQDIIFLNSNRSEGEQNIDCAHELVHLTLHRNLETRRFNSREELLASQPPELEWQADEGAAELIMPCKKFVPIFCLLVKICGDSWEMYESLKECMAILFKVTPQIIADRIEGLRYEIYQYQQGISVDRFHLVSIAEQESNGIYIKSYNQHYEEIRQNDVLRDTYPAPRSNRPRKTPKRTHPPVVSSESSSADQSANL